MSADDYCHPGRGLRAATRWLIATALIGATPPSACGLAVSVAWAQERPPEGAGPSFKSTFTYFYREADPTKVAPLLAEFNASPAIMAPAAFPAMIGFLAVLFAKYPNQVDAMIPPDLAPRLQGAVAVALYLAGRADKAREIADRIKSAGLGTVSFENVPKTLDTVEARVPNDFDVLWGASFASGDPRYCLKILDRFAAFANVDGHAEDTVAVIKARAANADLRWLLEKRGEASARDIVLMASALWSLDSNARQHEFVRSALDSYIKSHPDTPASQALLALR